MQLYVGPVWEVQVTVALGNRLEAVVFEHDGHRRLRQACEAIAPI